MEAEISLEYPTQEFARVIMKALDPDNELVSGGMRISTQVRHRKLRITIEDCERIETLESTVQDIFRCIRAAEESLMKMSPSRKNSL